MNLVLLVTIVAVFFSSEKCVSFIDSVVDGLERRNIDQLRGDSQLVRKLVSFDVFFGIPSSYAEYYKRAVVAEIRRSERDYGYELLWVAKICRESDSSFCSLVRKSPLILVRASAGDSISEDSVLNEGNPEKIASLETERSWAYFDSVINLPGLDIEAKCQYIGMLNRYVYGGEYPGIGRAMIRARSGISGDFGRSECRGELYAWYYAHQISKSGGHLKVGPWVSKCFDVLPMNWRSGN